MTGCYDCATCTARPELDLGMGSTPEEVQRLSVRCAGCGHRLFRHLHGDLRSHGWLVTPDRFGVDRPPRDSPLGRLMVEHGTYDDYYTSIRRMSPDAG